MNRMAELFRTEGLTHVFKSGQAGLRNISLHIDSGSLIVLAGRNGSGKTLLVRHFVGLSTPTAGKVFFHEEPVEQAIKKIRTSVGYVFQDADLQIFSQTVAEDVAFGPENLMFPAEVVELRVRQALSVTRLDSMRNRRPETLSGGEKRRLAIAGILAMEPECLILDEPFANLDLESINDVVEILLELHKSGKTLIVVTHELEKILPFADRLIILDNGELVFSGHPQETNPELYKCHGLVCPLEGHFPWVYQDFSFFSAKHKIGNTKKATPTKGA